MNTIETLKQALHTRIHAHPDTYYYVTLWEEMVAAFCSDLPAALHFIEFDCTDEELYYLGEVFDDIMEQTRSREFLDCLRRRVLSVADPEYKADILEDIRIAADYLDD